MNKNKREVFSADARLTLSRVTAAATPDTTVDGATQASEPVITLKGYPIVWNVLSTDRGGYKVKLAPGSATFTDPCLALYHHEFRDLLGNTANQTLRILPADDIGIPIEIDLPDTSTAADVAELVEDKYIGGMSFSMVNGFEESTTNEEDGQSVITVTKFTCDEVTVTVIPAFTQTSVEMSDDKESEDDGDEMKILKKTDGYLEERLNQSRKLQKNRLYLNSLSVGKASTGGSYDNRK